jgi:hypothetical protein
VVNGGFCQASMRGNLMVPMRMAGRVDNTGVVSAIGQHESDVGVGETPPVKRVYGRMQWTIEG